MGPLSYGGLGGLFGARPQIGFDPRMLDSITEPIVRFYGQEKMGPFRQELMGLIKETFPDFVEGGIMGAIQPYGGLSMDQFNMIADSFGKPDVGFSHYPRGVLTTSGNVGESAFGNSIKSMNEFMDQKQDLQTGIKAGLGSVFDMGKY
jgi:hypothetical protein